MAALLDFYGVRWEYEPRTFVLATGADGCPTMAFTPDFHLTDFDLFLEVTTLAQRLVTRKHRKVRMLAEQHPEVQVRIVHQRDYLELLVKYGLETPQQLARLRRPVRATAGERVGLLGAAPARARRRTSAA